MVVLSIGYQQLLLPDDKGVATAVKVLSRGVPCRYHSYSKSVQVNRSEEDEESLRIEIAYLPRGTKVEGELRIKPARARRTPLLSHEAD